MTRQELKNEVLSLPIEDRMDLMEDLRQSIEGEEPYFELTPEQRKELKRRIEEFEKNPEAGCSWEEFVAMVRRPA